MRRPRVIASTLALLCTGALLLPAGGAVAAAGPWATVNVCDTAGHPDGIGIRAGMPGNGSAGDRMLVRLRVQYRARSGRWRPAGEQADSGWLDLGSARARMREVGRTFTIRPPAGGGAFVLRGVATFEWRRGRHGAAARTQAHARRPSGDRRRRPAGPLRRDLHDPLTARSLLVALAAAAATLGLSPVAPAATFGDALWATVNRCDPPEAPGAVGVRVAVPARPRGGAQWVHVRLQFFDGEARAWRAGPIGRGRRLAAPGQRRPRGAGRHDVHLPAARRRPAAGAARPGRRRVAQAPPGRRAPAPSDDGGARRRGRPGAPDLAPVVRDQAVANSRGSFVMTPVTPRRSSAAMRAASSTVHT